jgi:hypothetical protein
MGKLATERVGEMDHPPSVPEKVTRLSCPAIISPSSVSAEKEGYAKDEEGSQYELSGTRAGRLEPSRT